MTPYETTLLGQVDRRFLSNKHVQRGFAVIAVVVMIVLAIQFVHKSTSEKEAGYREMLYGDAAATAGIERTEGAFGRWVFDIRLWQEAGKDPYRDLWFPTPPLVLALLMPFAKMPLWLGATLWAVLKLAAIVATAWLTFRALARSDRPFPFGIVLMTILFGVRPLIGDMQHGNINVLVLLPIAATFYLAVRGRDVWAGLTLALAVVMKLTPALLVVYYLYRCRGRVLLGVVAGLLVFGLLVPVVVFGPAQTRSHYVGWYGVMIEPIVRDGWVTLEAKNQSLPGTVLRLLAGAGAIDIEQGDVKVQLQTGMEYPGRPVQAWASWLVKALQLLVVAALAWLCRTRFADPQDPRVGLEFALVLLAMLMLSERTWKHHCVTLIMVYAPLWYSLACFAWTVRFRFFFALGLGVQFALLALSGKDVVGKAVGNALLFGGVVLLGLVLCFVQTAWILKRRWKPLTAGASTASVEGG